MSDTKLCPQCGTRYETQHRFCTLDGATLVSIAPRGDLIGSVIADRYLVTAKLGDGGMGQVYLAEHVRMKRKCAVKVMRPGLMSDPDAISRFNREAENASQVFHTNVAAVYDFGETNDGMIYLAMEYVDGESLAKLVERERAVHPVRAAEIIKQAADALDVAHGLGILHRDLKPENIMITRTRERLDLVKIVDFGIARAMTSDSQRVTRTGSMVGTPEYMSPEQFAGDELDARTDIYSLALVAFNMLTGASAYPSGTSKDNLIVRLTKPPRRLHEVKDLPWPEALQNTFDKALASNPADRYASVLDFSRDMTAAIASMPASQTGEIYLSALSAALAARASATPTRSQAPLTATPSQSGSVATVEDIASAPPTLSRKPSSRMLALAGVAAAVILGFILVQSLKKPQVNAVAGGDTAQSNVLTPPPVTAPESTAAPGPAAAIPTELDVFNRLRTGVVSVSSGDTTGVGFLADASGLVVTASHLLPRNGAPVVTINDTTKIRARVVVNDTLHGVAVLAIARNRCSRCTPLTVAMSDTGLSSNDSAPVIAIGATRPGRPRMLKGNISTFDARVIRTTAKPTVTEGGAPIVTLAGEVVGLSIFPFGRAAEVHFADLQTALAAARKLVAQPGFTAASDSLLPVRPVAPFPVEHATALAATASLDVMKKYRADRDNVQLFVMTPQMMAWREARAQAAVAARRGTTAPATKDKADPIQGWKSWDGCVKERCAVVVLNAVPERTPFLFHKLDVVDFNSSVGNLTLLRDGVAVEPIEIAIIPAVLNPPDYLARKKPVSSQGIAMYRAREFAPRTTGGISKFEVLIVDPSRGKQFRIALEPALIQTIINDFAPYGLTR